MRIMTAMYTLRRGGAYNRFIMMLETFLERGCAVHCLSLTAIRIENPCFCNHILFYPFRNKENSMAKLTVLLFFPLWSVWIGWRHKIDLIIAFGSLYALLLSFSKWLLQKPMPTFIRGNFFFGLRMENSSTISVLLNEMSEYCGLLFSDKIITNNSPARDEILKRLGKRKNIDFQVLYNNIPPMDIREPEDIFQTRDKYGIPRDAKVLVTAGILNRGKNIEVLIKCLPRINVEHPFLIVAGDGSTEADFCYKYSLQGLAKQLDVDKQVIFTDWLEKEDLWKIYISADLFVLPSLSEGMPNAMLEALGTGLPCMGSNIAGIRDILQYDELIFDPYNEKVLTNKIQQYFIGQKYFDDVKRFCQERKNIFLFNWKEMVFKAIMQP